MKSLSIFLLMLSLLSYGYSQELKIKDGVKYIHNNKPQWKDETKVKLEFIQEIGGMDVEDDYIMSDIRDIAKDKNDNLYTVSAWNSRIKKFDKNGKYIKTIGRKGNGPGEFNLPSSIEIDENGNIFVLNSIGNLVILLNHNGKEIKRFNVKSVNKMRILSNEKIIFEAFGKNSMSPDAQPLFYIYDFNGYLLYTLGKMTVVANDGKNALFELYPGVKFEIDKESNIYCSYEYKNKIEKWDENGNIIFKSDRSLKYDVPERYKPTVKRRKIDYSTIVSRGIGIDHQQRLWVTTYKKQPRAVSLEERDEMLFLRFGTKKEHADFEIFDKDGILLCSAPQPCNIFFFRIIDNMLYIIDENKMSVKIYKIIDI